MLPITYLFGVLARYAVANTVLLAYLANSDVGLGNVDNTADSTKRVKYATSAGSASSATKATQDSSSQTITSTYIKSLSVSGRTITYTKGDNTTGSITTQDTNTTYGVGTSTYSGTTKLYTTTGSNTDGTMTQKAISVHFPTEDSIVSGSKKIEARRSDNWMTVEGTLKSCKVSVALSTDALMIRKTDLNGNLLAWNTLSMFDNNKNGSLRHTFVHYFAGTKTGTSFVVFSIDDDGIGLTNRKLPQYPQIIATLQTNVGNDFYVVSADRISDRAFNIIFNREYTGAFVVCASFTTWIITDS